MCFSEVYLQYLLQEFFLFIVMLLIHRVSYTLIQNFPISLHDCLKVSSGHFCFRKKQNILHPVPGRNMSRCQFTWSTKFVYVLLKNLSSVVTSRDFWICCHVIDRSSESHIDLEVPNLSPRLLKDQFQSFLFSKIPKYPSTSPRTKTV